MTATTQKMTARSDSPRRDAEREGASIREDDAAFETAFLEHWPRVYGVLLGLVGDRDEAEDLALETFWRLCQRPPEHGRELNLGGWLYRVATNLGLNAIRGWKRRERYELEAGRREIEENSPADPAAIFVREEERRRVRQVLGGMRPREAQLLILRHSGLSYRELAAALGVSEKSIGTLLARAENEFEKRYGDE
ncbi:MAG: sigma-70 family RNA polymerase sigma factor [Chloroflexi bacterium]|nr:sigma-70 family RNA polymerase sigma factor [Chloroflexota bacterium]MBI3764857.1 sigma-70 family RNA polymerase sigma factor [Chloroflexota bacterium]